MTSSDLRVGFMGVGQMGSGMAANILKSGFKVSVFDVNAAAAKKLERLGGRSTASPKELASKSDVIVAMVTDSSALRSAVLGRTGALSGMGKGSVLVAMGTYELSAIFELAEKANASGVELIDAPVSGTPDIAAKGELIIMASGKKRSVDTYLPLLKSMAKRVFYVGKIGNGTIMKYLNNLLGVVNKLAALEATVFAHKAGIDLDTFYKVISSARGSSFQFDFQVAQILAKNRESLDRHTWHAKDLALVNDASHTLGSPLFLGSLAMQLVTAATNEAKRSESTMTLLEFYEKAMGTKIPMSGPET